jgi:hypothetical protein
MIRILLSLWGVQAATNHPTASILCCTILPAHAADLLPLLPTLKQGVLEMWVDIMKPEVASAFPPDDVSLPPTQMFEVGVHCCYAVSCYRVRVDCVVITW